MDTSENIAKKAYYLFTTNGIRNTTIKQIAADAGISKSTVYQYYENKDALVEGFVREAIMEYSCLYKKTQAPQKAIVEELFYITGSLNEFFNLFNNSIVTDLEKHHQNAFKMFAEYKQAHLHQLIKNNIELGIHRHVYKPDIEVAVMVSFMIESYTVLFDTEQSISNCGLEHVHNYLIHGMVITDSLAYIDKSEDNALWKN